MFNFVLLSNISLLFVILCAARGSLLLINEILHILVQLSKIDDKSFCFENMHSSPSTFLVLAKGLVV